METICPVCDKIWAFGTPPPHPLDFQPEEICPGCMETIDCVSQHPDMHKEIAEDEEGEIEF